MYSNDNTTIIISVLVHYESVQDCVDITEDLISINGLSHKIVIVDNNSDYNTYQQLVNRIKNKNVEIIRTSENNGFGYGVNAGVSYGLRFNPKYIHIINTDVRIINFSYLSELLGYLESHHDIGMIAPAVYKGNTGILQNTIMPFISLKNAILFKRKYNNAVITKSTTPVDVDCLNGVCFVMPAKLYLQIKGFDEDYFMYVEEHDLCYKIMKQGYRRIFYPIDGIKHHGAERNGPECIDWRYLFSRKNQVLFLKKRNKNIQAMLLSIILMLSVIYKIVFKQYENRYNSLSEIISAIFNPYKKYH